MKRITGYVLCFAAGLVAQPIFSWRLMIIVWLVAIGASLLSSTKQLTRVQP